MTGKGLEITKEFYDNDEAKVKVPRAGGILIWSTTIAFSLLFWFIMKIETNPTTQFLNFIDRRQTFIPLGTLFFASIAGFVDDALSTMEGGGNYFAGGLKLSHRFGFVTLLSALIGIWFYLRLELTQFNFAFFEVDFNNLIFLEQFGLTPMVGWLVIPLVIVVLLMLWGSSMIDGFDGLATGCFIPLYLCFAGLSFARGFYDIAALLMVMVGAMTAYLWYNIPPAKFYMGDTGTMGILLTIGVVAFLIDALYVLPIAGFVLLLTEGSVIIQTFSKKFLGKKVFKAAPIHHHFEAIGWLRHQVTMRYWLVAIMTSVLGLAVGLVVG